MVDKNATRRPRPNAQPAPQNPPAPSDGGNTLVPPDDEKLTPDEVRLIRKASWDGTPIHILASQYSRPEIVMWGIVTGRLYADLNHAYKPNLRGK